MNVMSRMLVAPTEESVMRLMADGKERTINDIRLRFNGDEKQARSVIGKLVRKAKLQSAQIGSGAENMTAWKLAEAKTWAEMARAEGHTPGVPAAVPTGFAADSVTMGRAGRIAAALAEHGPMTRAQIEAAVGFDGRQFNDAMQRCRVKYKIEVSHSGRSAPSVYALVTA